MENRIKDRAGHNPFREKWMKPVFKKMFDMVGETLTPEYVGEAGWYLKHSWSKASQDEFKYWLKYYLQKKNPWKSMTTKRLNDEVDWFVLSYGWKEEE